MQTSPICLSVVYVRLEPMNSGVELRDRERTAGGRMYNYYIHSIRDSNLYHPRSIRYPHISFILFIFENENIVYEKTYLKQTDYGGLNESFL